MKRLTTMILGLSLVLGTAGLSLAADEKKAETKPAADANTAQKDNHKKKTRKHKKQAKATSTSSTSSTSATPAPPK